MLVTVGPQVCACRVSGLLPYLVHVPSIATNYTQASSVCEILWPVAARAAGCLPEVVETDEEKTVMRDFSDVIRRLDSLDWSSVETTFPLAMEVFKDLNAQRELMRGEIQKMTEGDLARRVEVSQERASHFKWYMHKSISAAYRIWLPDNK